MLFCLFWVLSGMSARTYILVTRLRLFCVATMRMVFLNEFCVLMLNLVLLCIRIFCVLFMCLLWMVLKMGCWMLFFLSVFGVFFSIDVLEDVFSGMINFVGENFLYVGDIEFGLIGDLRFVFCCVGLGECSYLGKFLLLSVVRVGFGEFFVGFCVVIDEYLCFVVFFFLDYIL